MTGEALELSRPVAFRIALPCSLSEVRPAALRISDFLTEQGLETNDIQACELAFVEACNNAVDYATTSGRAHKVAVDVFCDGTSVEMRVRDHTPGFEWPSVIALPEPDQERGRGLFLIQTLMDEARYFRGPDTNCLFLQKNCLRSDSKAGSMPQVLEQLSHQLRESEQIVSDMAEELSFCYESLSAIFRCSAELGRSHSLKDFSQRLLSDLAQITSADWFVLRLLSRDGSKLSVFAASDASLQLPPLLLNGETNPGALELKAALGRQDVWFEGETLPEAEPLANAWPIGSIGVVHPFALGPQLVGTLAIGKAAGRTPFTAVHANVIHTFTDFLAIQMANARFQEEQVRAKVVSRELEIAKNIQRSLLPKSLPRVPGFELAGYCESAQEVGGDFYDVVGFTDKSLMLVIADVMGKGVPAAMFAAILRSLLRAVPEWTEQPAHLLSRVNRLLFNELSGVDMFITAQLVFIDISQQRLVAASAGHCPILLATQPGDTVRQLSPEGLPLGIMPDTGFSSQVEELCPNSRLLLYTDGLTEARNPEGTFFGQDRLIDWFEKTSRQSHSAHDLKTELAAELGRFQGSTEIQDDQTFLIMA